MLIGFNPSRFDLARRRRGMTKGSLAEAISVSARMITAYERGEKEPSLATLARIADVLDFPEEFFLGPDLEEPSIPSTSFRALSTLSARDRDQALGSGAIALALSDWIESKFALPEPTVPRYQGVDPETASLGIRDEWGLGQQPIRNVIHLLELHGVRVFSLVEECRALDAYSFWRRQCPFVFLNTIKSAERSRMDAAHELGHLVLHWRGDVGGREAEREADAFGAALLMPAASVLAEAPRSGRLSDLKRASQLWRVSVQNLTYRMHKLEMLSDWQYRSLFIEMNREELQRPGRDPNAAETSQVLGKVFASLREEGITKADVAAQLRLASRELDNLLFGLVLTPLDGGATRGGNGPRPVIRLI